MKSIVLAGLLYFSSISFASVTVAFMEATDKKGHVVQLIPEGRLSHIAISYENKWLHTHPYRGVEIVDQSELEKIGKIALTIEISDRADLTFPEISTYLGKPYDNDFSWSDEKIYCAELVAKILDINPTPMSFSSKIWPEKYKRLQGRLGSSPDEIFKQLVTRGYNPQRKFHSCTKFF